MCRHSRDTAFTSNRAYALVAGKVTGSFWRMPTDLVSFTPNMEFGMKAVDGKVVPVSVNELPDPSYWMIRRWPSNTT